MTVVEVLFELQKKLLASGPGRRFYMVTGSYYLLAEFKKKLLEKHKQEIQPFDKLKAISLNNGLIDYLELKGVLEKAIETERAERYDSVRRRLSDELQNLLTSELKTNKLICIYDLELLYGYRLSLTFLWDWAVNEKQIIILVPGEKEGKELIAFPWDSKTRQTFPSNLVKDEWTWELMQ